MKKETGIFQIFTLMLTACSSVYFGTMEKMGAHMREIMVDRVREARDTQQEAKKQFVSAMEQFKSVINFQGRDLEDQYNELNAALKKSESEAKTVHDRIESVENVSVAMFDEWRSEIKQYNSDSLRSASQK